jgi:hypothetical protein
MPIVIDEVVISINVENSASGDKASAATLMQNAQIKQQLLEECVEQVMEMLRQKQEP